MAKLHGSEGEFGMPTCGRRTRIFPAGLAEAEGVSPQPPSDLCDGSHIRPEVNRIWFLDVIDIQERNMKRFTFGACFALSFFVAAAAHAAESVGIPACDDFLAKYESCMAKIPAAQQPPYKTQIEKARSGWAAAAKNPSALSALEGACKSMSEQMKRSLQAYSCSF